MKLLFLAFSMVFLVNEVQGVLDFVYGVHRGIRATDGMAPSMMSSHRPRGGSSTMFPECKKLMDAVHQKMRESGSGSKCKNAENEEECRFKALMEARHQIAEQPSDECFDQVMQFLEGENEQETTKQETASEASVRADVSMKKQSTHP
ncbi:hypothetical protein CDAR_551731 [Caerostris darwini]|uniref:Uncharacterized protein n=1 Tax=Caerostris darwini TaxID=1538125 RepID=A0AAV4Q9V6_9ARAC|nr:hypothetical protein CDAR_551731 [Caerostris darwini]